MHVDGLVRTKDDIIKSQVKELFKVHNFDDVIVQTHNVRRRLESLGCFKTIDVYIDTSQGPDSTPEGIEVSLKLSYMRFIVKYQMKNIFY